MAKAYGSYNALHGGIINYCLTDLTGCPTEIKEQVDFSQWWDSLKIWMDRGFLAFVETEKIPGSDDPLKQGFSFAVLDMQEVEA